MHDNPPLPPIDDIRTRVCGEYMEMPGLRLTAAQAQRLWGLDAPTCEALFTSLVRDGFLHRHADGRYARLTDGGFAFPAARMARAAAAPSHRTSLRLERKGR
jgi:hypothetical protein